MCQSLFVIDRAVYASFQYSTIIIGKAKSLECTVVTFILPSLELGVYRTWKVQFEYEDLTRGDCVKRFINSFIVSRECYTKGQYQKIKFFLIKEMQHQTF